MQKIFFILFAKKAFRPAITASLKAFAISVGFLEFAIALLISTPSHPIPLQLQHQMGFQFLHLQLLGL